MIYREEKGIPLTIEEMDSNFRELSKNMNNVQLDFFWTNQESVESAWINGTYLLLGINIKGYKNIKNDGATYTLLIDRYRRYEWKGAREKGSKKIINQYRNSGYKHELIRDAINNERLSEIEIVSNRMLLDFNQDKYFRSDDLGYPYSKGDNKRGDYLGKVKLGFRIRKTIIRNGIRSIKESNNIGLITMIGTSANGRHIITYTIK